MFFRKKEAEGGSSAASGGPAAAAGTVTVSMTVNGKSVSADIDPRTLLVQFIRENQRLTGTHVGCDTSQCGACVVHLDGMRVKSCTVLAVHATARRSPPSRASPRTASCTRCRRPSASITACSAASVRPA